MAPNPIILPRKQQLNKDKQESIGLTWPLIATSFTVLFVTISSWGRAWLFSGCAVENLLMLYAARTGQRMFTVAPPWAVLAIFNLIYAISSTSWLLYALFTMMCWPFIAVTCLFQFDIAANLTRRWLRTILMDLHFTRDRIAFFNLPALEIDTEVSGLMVIRGITISLSSLTLVAHGVEVGIKITDDIELALYTDEVRVRLFRGIEVDDVYSNIKGGKLEMTFAEVEETEEDDDDSIFNETPLLRAATQSSVGTKERPKLQENLVGGSYIKDASAKESFDNIQTLSPDSQVAEKQYSDMLNSIRISSAIYQSRARVRQVGREKDLNLENDLDLRAAICADLHDTPSVPHPPSRSIRVTTLQNLSKPAVRRFMHRLPFLLRLLLAPLGYFHPLRISSINAAGSGSWLKELLQQEIFKSHAEHNAEIRRLQRRMSTWLVDANFCLQVTDIDGLGQVPISTAFDIVAYLHFADIMAYRTFPKSGILEQVIRLGGADATFIIPSFLLPHHEHILPPRPTAEEEERMEAKVEEADGLPKTVQAEQEKERVEKDEATITMSVHASLPVTFDQSLLLFIAALVKATKIIEFDREVEKMDPDKDMVDGSMTPISRTSTQMSTESKDEPAPPLHKRVQSDLTGVASNTNSRFKTFTKNLQQNLREASISTAGAVSKESVREFVRDVHRSTKDGMKKTIVGSMVNDRWIAKMIGKVAANLERAQGDVGYSGVIPMPLEPYRPKPGDDGNLSKLLP